METATTSKSNNNSSGKLFQKLKKQLRNVKSDDSLPHPLPRVDEGKERVFIVSEIPLPLHFGSGFDQLHAQPAPENGDPKEPWSLFVHQTVKKSPSMTALPPSMDPPTDLLPSRPFPQRVSSVNREAVVYNQEPSKDKKTPRPNDFRQQNGHASEKTVNDEFGAFDEKLLHPRGGVPDSPILGRLRSVRFC